jgi:hypothetical protein
MAPSDPYILLPVMHRISTARHELGLRILPASFYPPHRVGQGGGTGDLSESHPRNDAAQISYGDKHPTSLDLRFKSVILCFDSIMNRKSLTDTK